MNENIEQILKLNLTDEQKEALLGQLANEILEKNQVEEDSFEARLEKLKAKERQKTEALKKRLAEYEERSLKKENQRKRDEELEDKIKALSEITNQQGEKIFSNLSDLSGYEIDQLYDIYIEKNMEPNESNQVDSNNEEEVELEKVNSNDKKYRDLTLEEANKLLDLSNRIGPLTEEEEKFISALISETGVQNQDELVNNAKSLAGISEKTDDSINNNENTDENYRELTLEEAKAIIAHGNRVNNGELSEEEQIKRKPKLDKLMQETGAQDMNELYEKAREVVNKNKSNINSSTEKQLEFINKKDVSELNEEEKNHIRETLGLDDNEEITKDDLSKVQAATVDNINKAEGKEGATKIADTEKLKEKIKENAKTAAKIAGSLAMLGVAIATGFTLVPGLAAGALGFSAYQEFNKGKKL